MPGSDPDPSKALTRVLPGGRWEVQLLGGLLLRNGDIEVKRFPSQAVTLLFARLALAPRTVHAREELAVALWPKVVDASGREPADASDIRRNRLRRVLSTLRVLLEPPGVQPSRAVVADRDTVRLNAAAFDLDTTLFERHVARGQWAQARSCYRGELLPGLRDPWLRDQRARLAALLGRVDEQAQTGSPGVELDETPDADEAAPAPLVAAEEASTQRPIVPYVTRFFGRDTEVETLREALAAHHLVTITGPGGGGKTRLAAEAARDLQGFEPVTFVALADCDQPAYLYEHVRAALGLQPAARPALEQIVARLAGQRALLILDNFEQLVGAGGNAVLSTLRRRLPEAHLLLTSRRALRRNDQCQLAIAALALPGANDGLASVSRNPGVALFVDRARAVRLDFNLNARNVNGVVDVCRLLEGLPLSIELAAAKVRSHAPHEMAAALRRGSIELLARPHVRAVKPGRHDSLQTALAWSWTLLGPAERSLLRCLSTFRGGWTLEQARAVAQDPAADKALAALARDSLVQARPDADGAPRLHMLAVVREFVAGQLQLPGALALRHRHRAHFLAAATELDSRHQWPADADLPNLVEALASAWADDDIDTAAALAIALAGLWRARGAPEQALALLQHLARAERVPAAQRVTVLTLLSSLLLNAGQRQEAHAQAALALQAAGDHPVLRAEALFAQAALHWRAERDGPKALALLQAAEPLVPAGAEAAALRGRLLLLQGAIALQSGMDAAGAALLFEQAERLFGGLRDRRASLLALPGRTACLLAQGRYREVVAVASAGEQLAAKLGDVVTRLQLFDRLSSAHEASGHFDRALLACQRQTRLARAHGMAYFIAYGAWNQCFPLTQLGQPETAARLMAFARRYWVEQFGPLSADDECYIERVRECVKSQTGQRRWRLLWARGEALAVRDGIELASGP
jgi:predicted ATPase